jgi:hypothetical protein
MNDSPHTPDTHDDAGLDNRIRSMLGNARQAAPPAPQLDLDPSVVPLRRRDDRRGVGRHGWILAGLAAIGTAAAVMAAVVVMDDDSTERLQPAPPATEPDSVTTVPDSRPDPTSVPTTTAPADPSVIWVAYAAGPDGVIGIDATGRTVTVVDEPMASVAVGADGADGGLYVQRQAGPDGSVQPSRYDPEDTVILRFDPATSELVDVDVPQPAGTWLRLHDVGTLAGAQVLLYEEMQTPNPTGPDAGRLLLLDIATGDTTVVDDDFGGWERWSNLFQVADNGLIVGEKVDLTETYPTIFRVLDSAPDVTPGSLGLQPSYSECSTECPRHLTVDPTGTAFAYLYRGGVSWTDGVGQHWTELYSADDLSLTTQVSVVSDAVAVSSAAPDAGATATVRILTLDGRELEVPGTSVSLFSTIPVPTVTNDLGAADVDGTLVVNQNVATDDDLRRLPQDRSGTGLEMSCAGPQSRTWEYDAGFAPSESGRPASDQLTSAIAEVNAEFLLTGRVGELPTTGWTMIVDGSNRWFVLPTAEGAWWAVVSVAGKPWSDAWRSYDAWFCTEGPVPSPDDPFAPTPELTSAEDGMFAVTNALGDALTYASAQEAVDAVAAALTRPDGCEVDPTADVETLGETATSAVYRIEYRFGCDDSGGGFDLEITVTSPAADTWTITAATLQTYCLRGATDDGLCI